MISSETKIPHKVLGSISSAPKIPDKDNDGIPDKWEITNGLDPGDPIDAMKIAANGYINIEN